MSDHSPAAAAALLGIAPGTLRKWSQSFAPLLSPPAAASGPRARRRYSDSDIALLRHAALLLDQGCTYAQALAELGGQAEPSPGQPHQPQQSPRFAEVEVLQPSDQALALAQLVEIQRQLVEAQRQHIAQQQEQVASLAAQLDQQRQRWARLPRWVRWWFVGEE